MFKHSANDPKLRNQFVREIKPTNLHELLVVYTKVHFLALLDRKKHVKMDNLEVPMVSGNLYHIASAEAISDFWKLDINFAEGGGLIFLEKLQVKHEGDEQFHFIALFEGGG